MWVSSKLPEAAHDAHQLRTADYSAPSSSQFLVVFATAPGMDAEPGLFTRVLLDKMCSCSPAHHLTDVLLNVTNELSTASARNGLQHEMWYEAGGLTRGISSLTRA
jgi:hypothetical protein